jgi:hypothetical protein
MRVTLPGEAIGGCRIHDPADVQMRKLTSTIRDAAPWLGLTAVIGLVDYFTPSAYAFASIYFIPIFPAAWRSRAVGFIVAAASSFAWIYCDYVQRPVDRRHGADLELHDPDRRVRPCGDPGLDPPTRAAPHRRPRPPAPQPADLARA